MVRIAAAKKEGGVDLSTAEDLSLAVMNLISLEEHFFFTAAKTGERGYFDLSGEIREERKRLLAALLPNHEGETWCASKHLLAATMRLIEVGNKLLSEGQKVEAGEFFAKAYKLYSIFWGLRLKLLDVKKLKDDPAGAKPMSLEDLVTKLADCCNE